MTCYCNGVFTHFGLRFRLFVLFGSLIAGLSVFSAAMFLNVERSSLMTRRQVEIESKAISLLTLAPESRAAAANLAGLSRFEWGTSLSADWHVDDRRKQWATYKERWYGQAPVSLEVAGTGWRAEVMLHAETAILDRSAALLAMYLMLNTLVVLVFGVISLTRVVVRPVSALANAMKSVRGPVSEFRSLEVRRHDEIGSLTQSFNELMARIRGSEEKNAKYVTQLETAYRQLERAQEQLLTSEKLASLGRLSAGIAHEIGNPLSAVTGYLTLLKTLDSADTETRDDILKRASAEALRIDRIIRGLLDFARPRTETDAPVAPLALLEPLVEGLQHQTVFKDIKVSLAAGENLPMIRTGGGRLEQVLVNLCINAADAMQGRGTLQIEAGFENGKVFIRVVDNGPGIAAADLPHIFEPFFTTKEVGKGTGLGLAISYQIVAALHGTLHVDSNLGQGAVFTMEFPPAASSSDVLHAASRMP